MLKLYVSVQTRLLPQLRTRLESRKAAGLLEYALVALISVAVFGVLYAFFKDYATTLFNKIKDSVTSGSR